MLPAKIDGRAAATDAFQSVRRLDNRVRHRDDFEDRVQSVYPIVTQCSIIRFNELPQLKTRLLELVEIA